MRRSVHEKQVPRYRRAGYHPLRKIGTVLSGLRYAVIYDFSVAYKLVLSAVPVVVAFFLRAWVDVVLIVLAIGMVLVAEMFNSDRGACDLSNSVTTSGLR